MIRVLAGAGLAVLLLAGCGAPRWSSPHRFPLETGRPFLETAPAGWGSFWIADGMVASLHGPVLEQVVAGSIDLSSRQAQAIAGASTPALAAAEIHEAMRDGDGWWWMPGRVIAVGRQPPPVSFTVAEARADTLDGRPGVAFDGLVVFDPPIPGSLAYRIRARTAVVGGRLHFVALGGARRVYFDAAVVAFDETVGRFRIDAPAGSR